MTRHELKEQVQHDQFTDTVSDVVNYAASHRQQLIRYGVIALVVLVIAGAGFWYASYKSSIRQQDLSRVFLTLDAPVGQANPTGGLSFPNAAAKTQASMKALSDFVAKNGGTREGLIAQYYLGTLKAQDQDTKGAEADLRRVANSSSQCASLAKIALAELLTGENRVSEAQTLLQQMIDKPTDLVSKGQAQVLLARLDQTTNPQQAKKILQSLTGANADPVVARAADQVSAQLQK